MKLKRVGVIVGVALVFLAAGVLLSYYDGWSWFDAHAQALSFLATDLFPGN